MKTTSLRWMMLAFVLAVVVAVTVVGVRGYIWLLAAKYSLSNLSNGQIVLREAPRLLLLFIFACFAATFWEKMLRSRRAQ